MWFRYRFFVFEQSTASEVDTMQRSLERLGIHVEVLSRKAPFLVLSPHGCSEKHDEVTIHG